MSDQDILLVVQQL